MERFGGPATRFCCLQVACVKTTTPQAEKPEFQKTGIPCLYRYSSNGVHYALAKHEGKQKRSSLETRDKAEAKRKLADFQRNLGKVDTTPKAGSPCASFARNISLRFRTKLKATIYRNG